MSNNFNFLSVVSDSDIKRLNVLIENCVIKLVSYLNRVHVIHLNNYKKDFNKEALEVVNNNFNELYNYLNCGYDLVKCCDLSLQWYFLERFWFLVNSKSFLSSVEKNNFRSEIEYIEHKINLLIKKYKSKI